MLWFFQICCWFLGGIETVVWSKVHPKTFHCDVTFFLLHLSIPEAFKLTQFCFEEVKGHLEWQWNKNKIGFDLVFYSIYECKPWSPQNKPLAFQISYWNETKKRNLYVQDAKRFSPFLNQLATEKYTSDKKAAVNISDR